MNEYTIIWGRWQIEHIRERHDISREEFVEAWHDRLERLDVWLMHGEHGPYCESFGYTNDLRFLKLIWRWQEQHGKAVWPITAHPADPPLIGREQR